MATTTNNGWTIPASTDYVKDGYAAIDTLGQAIDTSVGTGLLAWQSYTPTLTGWGVGNGTWDARYCKMGKTVQITIAFTAGSTTTFATGFTFSLPAGMTAKSIAGFVGTSSIACGVNATGIVTLPTTTTARVFVNDAAVAYTRAANITSTGPVPGSWGTGNTVWAQITLEII